MPQTTSPVIETYCLYDADARYHAYIEPNTGKVVRGDELEGNCHYEKPASFERDQALAHLQALQERLGGRWELDVEPRPCPACGREIWANDGDFCYPQSFEGTSWRAGCNEHDFGCGFEVTGPTFEDTMRAWNAATPEKRTRGRY